MKKFIFAVLMLFATTAMAADKTLDFTWDQVLPSPNDLSHFTLYEYDNAGNPTGDTFHIPYITDMSYVHSEVITVPDDQSTELCYDITASDNSGNESGKSNRPCKVIDFESPADPTSLTITINVVPQ